MNKVKNKGKSLEELLEEALVPVEEQPYELPGNWVWVKLGAVVSIGPSKPKLSYEENQSASFISMSAVDPEKGQVTVLEEREFGRVKKGYTYFEEGDILFAKITPCMENGNTAIAKNLLYGFGFGSTEFFVLRTSEKIEQKFLYYLLRSEKFRKEAKAVMSGAVGQQRVPKSFLENYTLMLPPLTEQKRITNKIESFFAKIDEAKQLIDEARESFELRRTAILDKAFRGELTKEWRRKNDQKEDYFEFIENLSILPDSSLLASLEGLTHWRSAKIKDLFTVYGGGTPSKSKDEYWSGDIPWLSPKDMKALFLRDTIDHISSSAVENSATKKVRKNSVSIVVRSGILNHSLPVATLSVDYTLNQDMKAFDSGNDILNEYLLWYIHGHQKELLKLYSKSGTTVGSIIFEKFKNHLIPIPPYEELKLIIDIIRKQLNQENNSHKLLLDMQPDLLKQSILQKAFRGELDTNDPAEESAIELLKENLRSQPN